MAPSEEEIREIIQSMRDAVSSNDHESLKKYVSAYDTAHVAGEEHGDISNLHELGTLISSIEESIDKDKPNETELVRVIGGGDNEWAALEYLSTGTSTTGKLYYHEYVVLLHFDYDGKIDEARGFFDTHHIHRFLGKH
jgi:hypothetical protein